MQISVKQIFSASISILDTEFYFHKLRKSCISDCWQLDLLVWHPLYDSVDGVFLQPGFESRVAAYAL